MLLACASLSTVVLYRWAMLLSVSPERIVWTVDITIPQK
jgi:hypothetical protein